MTKPRILASSIGAAGLVFAVPATLSDGAARVLCAWVLIACLWVSVAYLTNRPGLLGKRRGRLSAWRSLPIAPYLLAYAIASWIRRARRRYASWDAVAPGLYVGARVPAAELPAGLELVVDLTAEIPEAADVRSLPGYRSLPVLDGSCPPDEERFLELLGEMSEATGGVYLHCISGRGRAPSAAATVLLARGVASDAASALELVCKGRSVARPTEIDVRFVERIAARLRRSENAL